MGTSITATSVSLRHPLPQWVQASLRHLFSSDTLSPNGYKHHCDICFPPTPSPPMGTSITATSVSLRHPLPQWVQASLRHLFPSDTLSPNGYKHHCDICFPPTPSPPMGTSITATSVSLRHPLPQWVQASLRHLFPSDTLSPNGYKHHCDICFPPTPSPPMGTSITATSVSLRHPLPQWVQASLRHLFPSDTLSPNGYKHHCDICFPPTPSPPMGTSITATSVSLRHPPPMGTSITATSVSLRHPLPQWVQASLRHLFPSDTLSPNGYKHHCDICFPLTPSPPMDTSITATSVSL